MCISDLTNLPDEQLCLLFRDGNMDAIAVLISRYLGLVRSKASFFDTVGLERDDLIQEGLLGVLDAAKNYDEEKKASFRTFASKCIQNKLSTAASTASSKKNHPLNCYVELDEGLEQSDMVPNPETLFISKETVDILSDHMKKLLSDLELSVLLGFLDGLHYEELAESLGVSVKSVGNALQRVRKKLKAVL